MSLLSRLGLKYFADNLNAFILPCRSISLSSSHKLKEIQETRKGKEIIVEGVFVSSPRENMVVKPPPGVPDKPPCYMCSLELDVKHTDVMILSQFVRSDGCMLPKRVTGLCSLQQTKIGKMVTMAQKAGLMINLTPSNCNKDPTKRGVWKKYNTYFDEKTIFQKRQPKALDRFKPKNIFMRY